MKIALITDTHYGARGDNIPFLDYQKLFFDNIFFKTIEKHNINTIIHLGDLVDRRKYINFNTAKRMREDFILRLWDRNVHFIAGNHDVYHKSTNSTNVYEEVLHGYEHKVYTHATEVTIDNQTFLFLPWINQENFDHTMEKVKQTKAQVCLGHLEIQGYEMNRGHLSDHGLNSNIFDKFDLVFSGHFHHKSSRGNIHYLGAPYQMTWSDYGTERGFHIYDTETRELKFIQNHYSMFNKFLYNDENKDRDMMMSEINKSYFENVYCKLIVEKKTNSYLFDMVVGEIEKKNPLDLKIVEAQEVFSRSYEPDEHIEDTLTILKKYVNETSPSNKKQLEELMIGLYNTAHATEI